MDVVRRDSIQEIIDAVVELYEKICGSCNSSYSWLVTHLSGIDWEYISE